MQNKSFLPIKLEYYPITKLALVPFEKKPERIYRGFEIQYLNSEKTGEGYRILAYRNDQYVDVYDDMSLNFNENETFEVVENGANQHVQIPINNVRFEKIDQHQVLGFEFTDIEGRRVSFSYEEKTDRKLNSMNLPAPVGMGSKSPTFLPLFFMYDFDFMRKKADVHCSIDGVELKIDNFPVPMNGQRRSFCRYSNDCVLMMFADTQNTHLEEVLLNESMQYIDGQIIYQFKEQNVLESITAHVDHRDTKLTFDPPLSLNGSTEGVFLIKPSEKMGYIKGHYSVAVSGSQAKLQMMPDEGWTAVPTSLTARMIMGEKSLFRCWFKKYEYQAEIDLEKQMIHAQWTNYNIEK